MTSLNKRKFIIDVIWISYMVIVTTTTESHMIQRDNNSNEYIYSPLSAHDNASYNRNNAMNKDPVLTQILLNSKATGPLKQDSTVKKIEAKSHTEILKKQMLGTNQCEINVSDSSIRYFQNWLKTEPHVVQFRIRLSGNKTSKSSSSAFKPFYWVWTPNTTAGPYPFLSWNIDYGLLSFGLLETSTVYIPFINLHVVGDCNLTFGTDNSSDLIANALGKMLIIAAHRSITFPYSYFCFLTAREELLNTANYYAALYIIYPVVYISYQCCSGKYNFEQGRLKFSCNDTTPAIHKWDQTTLLPFLIGLLILAYCPIYLCDILAWMSKKEHISNENNTGRNIRTPTYQSLENDKNWVFEDGESPLTFYDIFSFNIFGIDNSHQVLVSRLRRFICLLIIPFVIYFQLFLYRNGIGLDKNDLITVSDLVDAGAPMGFLSILGRRESRSKVFVPYLGGPVGIVVLYYVLGLLFLVFPRSLKQIIDDGLPSCSNTNEEFLLVGESHSADEFQNENRCIQDDLRGYTRFNTDIKSPLFFGNNDIVKASKVHVRPHELHPGYTRSATLMRCSIYMLFTKLFWCQVVRIQRNRLSARFNCSLIKKALVMLILPLYTVFCLLESLCCVVYYGFPFCFFVVVLVKGASTGLVYLKEQTRCLSFIFNCRIFSVLCVSIVFVLSSVFAYIVALIFLKSFGVLSQIFVLCFISIIIYPSVSFGYIFFFTAALYFCFRQIRHFGDDYSDLLSTAVELSDRIEGYSNKISIKNDRFILSNVRYEDMHDVRVNGKVLDVSQNVMRTVLLRDNLKIREKNNILGIPKKLFKFLVKMHRPVHQHVLHLVFKVAAMASLIIVTLSISSDYVNGPTSDISEVMHVIFIVAVGALPELIEVTVSYRDDEHVKREIEERKIEQSIREFWNSNEGSQN